MDQVTSPTEHHNRWPAFASTFALAGGRALGLARALSERGRVPRQHPFGWGRSCDGCDVAGEYRQFTNGGQYCDDCAAYVAEVTGWRPSSR